MGERITRHSNRKRSAVDDYFPTKKQESFAQQKLKSSNNLLKELENDFDDFENFLNSNKTSDIDHKIDTKTIESLKSTDKLDLMFKKNQKKYKEILDDYENLEFFVEDKEDEERNDQVRSLQEYNSIVHDTFGYNVYFNKLFFKLDKLKMESILNEHKIVNLIDRSLSMFLYAEGDNKKKHWIYNAYTDDDLLMPFEERKAVYDKFDLWLKNLHEFYYENKKNHKDYEPDRKRQARLLRKNNSESEDKRYPIHNEINLNVLMLLQVLFLLSNDFYHHNMKYQYAFNPIFDLNNYLAYIKKYIPIIYERMSTITLKELNVFKFFKGFLDREYVNDYHIGIFMKLKLLPRNIVDIFRQAFYGDDFDEFVKKTMILNVKDIDSHERTAIELQDPEIREMKDDIMLKNSLINLQSCIKMEENHLLSIKRAIKIQNYLINREKTSEIHKQMRFLQSIVTGKEVEYYKHLAMGILKELHQLKIQERESLADMETDIEIISNNDKQDAKEKTVDEEDEGIQGENKQADVNNYGFSNDSLPDLFIKRLIETKLISYDDTSD
ncbi:hypothetical protein ACO0R3_000809 [Hanseniaspora guilliermondii]